MPRHIIADAVGAVAPRPDIDADDPACAGLQAPKRRLVPVIVEAEPVDDGAVLGRAEDAGALVAALRARRQRAHLDEAETHGEKLARHPRVLVEARRHADRIWKVETEQMLAEALVVGRVGARVEAELQTLDREVVRTLGIERKQERLA